MWKKSPPHAAPTEHVSWWTRPTAPTSLLWAADPVLRAGDVELDTASRQVTVSGAAVHLTKTEYAILKLLLQNPGQAVAKSVILERISLDTPDCTEYSLKQHVSNLRKKLREAGDQEYIQAVWGIGFRLDAEGAGKS